MKENNISGGVFCDLFAGTGVVGDYFKGDYRVIANDFMHYSYVFNQGKLLNKQLPSFSIFKKKYHTDPFSHLNSKVYKYNSSYYITNEYSPRNNRQFFTEENAIKIDGIRQSIEKLFLDKYILENEYFYLLASLLESVMGVSNTSGTYEAFLKDWDKRSFKPFMLVPLGMFDYKSISTVNKVFCKDSNELLRSIEGDVLYIDTPYTVTEYSSAYHLLETISKYDYPEIHGKTGRRVHNDKKSDYTKKRKAIFAFEDMFRQANFKDIIISYSTQSIVPLEDLVQTARRFAINHEVFVKKIPYREYKNLNASQKGDDLHEVLIYFKKDLSLNKSPLNYSGSKNNILTDIINLLPQHVGTFVDVMGGAFNVGANVVATDRVVFNDYNKYVYEIVKLISETNREELVQSCEAIISRFNLRKSEKDGYLEFRNYYNTIDNSALNLFVLSMFCFQNQIRFNSSQKFNTPIGNCAYNQTISDRIINFIPKSNMVEFTNKDFRDLDYGSYKDAVFYFDPPYFITNATYNDGKRGLQGWDKDLEADLLNLLDRLDSNNQKFMLANVVEHKGKINHLLMEWIKQRQTRYNITYIDHPTRKEVVIRNYSLEMTNNKETTCKNKDLLYHMNYSNGLIPTKTVYAY
jgi:adenine-specific DNA-methyltransferase